MSVLKLQEYLKQCDLKVVTVEKYCEENVINKLILYKKLQMENTSFTRLKYAEIKRRIDLCLAGECEKSVDAMVAVVGISRSSLFRHFNGIYGATLTKYLNRVNSTW